MKDLIEELRPQEPIRSFMDTNEEWIHSRARQLGVMAKYITTQTLLHLPYYDQEDIQYSQPDILRQLDEKVMHLGEDYAKTYNRLYTNTDLFLISTGALLKGRHDLAIHDEAISLPVKFKEVPVYLADEINNRLHYIRSTRNDNLANFGLFIDNNEIPYACVSFSTCKRGYQIDALNRVAGLNLLPHEVISMTRAYTFNNAPKNSMSKLFHQSHEYIKQQFPDIKAVVTALNPYTGFDGGIFTGASYTPYALSPMEYWYDNQGYYVPRSKGKYLQKTATPPIIWLAHGLEKSTNKVIEKISRGDIKKITQNEYRNG